MSARCTRWLGGRSTWVDIASLLVLNPLSSPSLTFFPFFLALYNPPVVTYGML